MTTLLHPPFPAPPSSPHLLSMFRPGHPLVEVFCERLGLFLGSWVEHVVWRGVVGSG